MRLVQLEPKELVKYLLNNLLRQTGSKMKNKEKFNRRKRKMPVSIVQVYKCYTRMMEQGYKCNPRDNHFPQTNN